MLPGSDEERFYLALRHYRSHVLCAVLGVLGAALGFAFMFGGAPSGASLGAPFVLVSASHAWRGGRAMNLRFDSTNRELPTRVWEDLSPTERVKHAHAVAVEMVFGALFLVALDAWLLANRWDSAWVRPLWHLLGVLGD